MALTKLEADAADVALRRNRHHLNRMFRMWKLGRLDGDFVGIIYAADDRGWAKWSAFNRKDGKQRMARRYARLARRARRRRARGLDPTTGAALLYDRKGVRRHLARLGALVDLSQPAPPGWFYAVVHLYLVTRFATAVYLLPDPDLVEERDTSAFRQALAVLDLDTVPVLTEDPNIPAKQRADLVRQLLHDLGLPGVRVIPRPWDDKVEVIQPRWLLDDKDITTPIREQLCRLLARAFPAHVSDWCMR
jgi:hypothetical protein